MSTTANVQSYLPYVFRPVYTWTGSNFSTSFNISNVDTITVNTATFGRMNIGDSNQNVYVGSNAGNAPSNATAFVTYYNTAIGISAGAGISNASNSEFVGYLAGNSGKSVYNTIIAGMNAGGLGATSNSISNIYNSILIGTSNSTGLSNVSNTISIGGNAGGGGSSNIFMGTSNGIGAAGSCNIVIGANAGSNMTGTGNVVIGNGVYPAIIPSYTTSTGSVCNVATNMSNKFFLGSGSNIIAAGDFSNGVFVVGSTNTNAWSCNTSYPTSPVPNISLDVYKYARFQYGLSIGRDPGTYTLDVNGQFRASDSFGQLAISNVAAGASSNSYVEMRPADNASSTMTLKLYGNMTVSPSNGLTGSITVAGTTTSSNIVATNEVAATGYSSIQNAALSVVSLSGLSAKTLLNVTGNGTLATYTTTATHGFATSNWVTIATGALDAQGFTGITAQITSNGTTTFTISNSNALTTTATSVAVTPIAYPLLSFPITKAGLLVGTVYDTAITSNYQTANYIIRSPANAANNVAAAATLGSGSLLSYTLSVISNQMIIGLNSTAAGNLTVGYNFTYYPTS